MKNPLKKIHMPDPEMALITKSIKNGGKKGCKQIHKITTGIEKAAPTLRDIAVAGTCIYSVAMMAAMEAAVAADAED